MKMRKVVLWPKGGTPRLSLETLRMAPEAELLSLLPEVRNLRRRT